MNFVLIFGLKVGLFGAIASMTSTNAIIFAINEWFLMSKFRLEFDEENDKLFDFGQIRLLLGRFWQQAWPSILVNLINTSLLFCLFVKSGEISAKDMLPAIGIQIFLNDMFVQLSKGYE